METDKPQLAAPSLPWKTRIALSVLSTVTDATRHPDGTVNRRLLNLLDFKSLPNSNPINGGKTADINVDSSTSRNLWFRLFAPTTYTNSDDDLPVIVFFHGGGFVYLSADSFAYDAVCRRLALKVPAIVISVNYRLAPEHKYPAQYDDGFDVLKFVDEDASRSGLPGNADVSRCFLAGDSAGGNLAHHVARKACQTKFQKLKVIGLVSIQPFFGGEERAESEMKYLAGSSLTTAKRTDWMWKVFLPSGEEGCDRDHGAINVSGPRAFDISPLDFPATMIVVSGFDALKDWQMRYYDWLTRSGKEAYLVEYPTMVHAFYVFPELPESTQLISQVKDFIHKQCSLVTKSREL